MARSCKCNVTTRYITENLTCTFFVEKRYQKESKIILVCLQNYIFLSDERPNSLVFENVLGESSPPARCPIPDGGQVGIQPVSPVNLQMLGQVVRPGKTLLTNSASGKKLKIFPNIEL